MSWESKHREKLVVKDACRSARGMVIGDIRLGKACEVILNDQNVQKVTREYMAAVVKAREERDAAHMVEEEARRQALKDNDHGDPVVCLLHVI